MPSYRPGDSVVRDGLGAAAAVIACIFAAAIFVLVMWMGGWWFTSQGANKQAVIDRQGIGFQQPLQDQIGAEIGQVRELDTRLVEANGNTDLIGVLASQRRGTVIDICRKGAQVNPAIPLSGDRADFVNQNCSAGAIAQTSPYK